MSLVLAIPRGRIALEMTALLQLAGVEPEAGFFASESRKLRFATNLPNLSIVRVRSFDVASIVALGGADIGVVGSEVRREFGTAPIRAVLDLQIGFCRLSVATRAEAARPLSPGRRIKVATKYPNIAKEHFAARGIDAKCVKLHGAVELAPELGLSEYVVDLVSTGATLAENGLSEIETICEVSSELIVNPCAPEAKRTAVRPWIECFETAVTAMRCQSASSSATRGLSSTPRKSAG